MSLLVFVNLLHLRLSGFSSLLCISLLFPKFYTNTHTCFFKLLILLSFWKRMQFYYFQVHRKLSFHRFFFKSSSQLLSSFFHQNFSSQSISCISFSIRQLVPQKHWVYWLAPSSICRDWKQSGHDHLSLGNHQLWVQYSIHLISHNEIQTELPHFGFHIFHTSKPSIILTKNVNVLPLTNWNFQRSFPAFKQHIIIFFFNLSNRSMTELPTPTAALPLWPHKQVYNG